MPPLIAAQGLSKRFGVSPLFQNLSFTVSEGDRIGLPTLFFPMLRIERIALDEARGSIPSLAEVFEKKVGRSLADYLAEFA